MLELNCSLRNLCKMSSTCIIGLLLISLSCIQGISHSTASTTSNPVCKYLLSEWCEWSRCTTNQEVRIQTRKKTPEYPVGYQGPTCNEVWEYRECKDEDHHDLSVLSAMCEEMPWSSWTDCVTNSRGKKVRMRVKHLRKKSAVTCQDISHHFVDEEECRDECSWESWSPCYNYNPIGERPKWERYRERPITLDGCEGDWVQYQACRRCGSWLNWESWGECLQPSSSDCGRLRVRGMNMSYRGRLCDDVEEPAAECGACSQYSSTLAFLRRRLTQYSTSVPTSTRRTTAGKTTISSHYHSKYYRSRRQFMK